MNRSPVTTGAATGMTLMLALAACGDTGTETEEPMEPEANQEESDTNGDAEQEDAGADEDMADSDEMEDSDDADDMKDMDHGDDADDHGHDGDDEDMGDADAGGDLSAVMPESTGDPFADARTAAQHMPGSAENFAVGFTNALDISGEPQSESAELRGDLTAMFQEHVYLAGIAVATAYHAGSDSDEFALVVLGTP